jgi:hypothetical protein
MMNEEGMKEWCKHGEDLEHLEHLEHLALDPMAQGVRNSS